MTTYQQDEADRFLMGTGGKSAKFEQVGDQVRGYLVTKPVVRQRTDIRTGQPLTWDNGDPQNQLVIQLQTEERDPQQEDDDGIRNLYAKGSRDPASKSMLAAIAQAVKTANVKGLDVGGYLIVQYIGDGVSKGVGLNPPKQYNAWYTPPSDMMLQQQAAQAPEPPQAQAPHVQPPAPPQTQQPYAPPAAPPPAASPAPAPPPAPAQAGPPSPPPAPPTAPAAPAAPPPPPAAPGTPPPPPPMQQGAPPQQQDQWAQEEPPF